MTSPLASSIRGKLLLVVVATTLAALLFTGAAMVWYDVRTYQQSWVDDIMTQADILGRASTPALAFDDSKVAYETLSLLKARPQITSAAIYTSRGKVFASYPADTADIPDLPESDGYRIDGKELVVFKRVVDRNQILGTVFVRARYALVDRIRSYLAILGAVMIASLAIAVLLSAWLNRAVTRPILAVSVIARRISESRDFSLRATRTTDDEVGDLVDGFNHMLAEITRRAGELEDSNRSLAREVAERRAAEEALRVSEERNRTLVTAVTAVVWNADRHLHFAADQVPWTNYTGQQPDACCGAGWHRAFHPGDLNRLEVACAHAVNEPAMFELDLRLWHAPTQAFRYVGLRAVPVHTDDGGVREWIGTVDDIDDRRRAREELEQLNAELEQRVTSRTAELQAANKEMETFSYSVSHDLRAPVRAVTGFAQILREDHGAQLDDEGRRKLGVIQDEAMRMGRLIDDLLAFSRLSRQSMEPTELDMTEMARQMFERLKHHDGDGPAQLRLGSLPRTRGDRGMLDQVWANLLSNALKYSSKRESPVVEVGAITDDDEHIYYVRDNGAGFDPRYKHKLFGVFQRLHDASEFTGTGVGLALVQRIVLRHRGRVWAEGEPDHGASFYFALPREGQHAGS